jgi:hypothetical protein
LRSRRFERGIRYQAPARARTSSGCKACLDRVRFPMECGVIAHQYGRNRAGRGGVAVATRRLLRSCSAGATAGDAPRRGGCRLPQSPRTWLHRLASFLESQASSAAELTTHCHVGTCIIRRDLSELAKLHSDIELVGARCGPCDNSANVHSDDHAKATDPPMMRHAPSRRTALRPAGDGSRRTASVLHRHPGRSVHGPPGLPR